MREVGDEQAKDPKRGFLLCLIVGVVVEFILRLVGFLDAMTKFTDQKKWSSFSGPK